MKKNISLLVFFILPFIAVAQSVAINNDGSLPNSSAMLDIKSISKGLLIPRMTTQQRTTSIINPAEGLKVFDTNTKTFWFYNGVGWIELASGSPTNFWSLNGTNIFNNNAGNVGLGINTPLAALHIKKDNEAIRIQGSTPYISFYNSAGITLKSFVQNFNDDLFLGTPTGNTAGIMQFYLNNNPVMTMKPTGQVGIGTILPMDKLTVQTASNEYGVVQTDGVVSVGTWIGDGGGGTGGWMGTKTNHPLNLFTNNGAPTMTVLTNGNVGVGTSQPDFKLTIASSVIQANNNTHMLNLKGRNPVLAFSNENNVSYGYIKMWSNAPFAPYTNGLVIGSNPGYPLFFSTNNYGVSMTVADNGNVGIGTTNPTYKLSVNGNIRSKEVVVESGWADYVFDENYKLPSLQEVEKFIQQHKHLPNIPSAREVEEKGLHLGDTQKKMMEKIEELTLYIITQDKRIEILEKKLTRK